jgi:hypothetical protein
MLGKSRGQSYLLRRLNDDNQIWRQVREEMGRSVSPPRIRKDLVMDLVAHLRAQLESIKGETALPDQSEED